MRTWAFLLISGLVTACSAEKSGSVVHADNPAGNTSLGATVTGQDGAMSLAGAHNAIFSFVKEGNQNGLVLLISDANDICDMYGASQQMADTNSLMMFVVSYGSDPNSFETPVSGTYAFVRPASYQWQAGLHQVLGLASKLDGTCAETLHDAAFYSETGSLALSNISASTLQGSFTMGINDGVDTLAGKFVAANCPSLGEAVVKKISLTCVKRP
ncbi:MAG: hypothetical protein EOO40_02650 [Deltaproteobacteria bacterium]|nr:MAG: hypothetical protein EOO40_02650 [Deltaproteobacteria bacterium]